MLCTLQGFGHWINECKHRIFVTHGRRNGAKCTMTRSELGNALHVFMSCRDVWRNINPTAKSASSSWKQRHEIVENMEPEEAHVMVNINSVCNAITHLGGHLNNLQAWHVPHTDDYSQEAEAESTAKAEKQKNTQGTENKPRVSMKMNVRSLTIKNILASEQPLDGEKLHGRRRFARVRDQHFQQPTEASKQWATGSCVRSREHVNDHVQAVCVTYGLCSLKQTIQ